MPAEMPVKLTSLRASGAFVAIAALVAVALGATSASAATRTASSPVTGMNATLSGVQLTVTPGERVSRAFLNDVRGRPVTVACVTGGQDLVLALDEDSLVPSSDFDVAFLGGPTPWPAGGSTLSYTLSRDISEKADGCLVGRDPAVASTFGFNELGRGLLAEGIAEQRLMLAHEAAKQIARARADRRFPSPRALAAAIAASEPQMQVAFARSVLRARRNDVVHVIGRATNHKRVVLAYRQNDGQPVQLEGRRRGDAQISSFESREEPIAYAPGDEPGRRRPASR